MILRGEVMTATAIAAALSVLLLIDKGWSDYIEDRDNHRTSQHRGE